MAHPISQEKTTPSPQRIDGRRNPTERAQILLCFSPGTDRKGAAICSFKIYEKGEHFMAKKALSVEKETILNGYVEEIELEDGESGIIIDDGDEEYYVVMDKIGKRLLQYLDEEIEAVGIISRNEDELTFKVSRFKVVDYYRDEDEEDFDYGEMDED
jgi:hypothetical protein